MGQYCLFAKEDHRVQYCSFPKEGKGVQTALLSRKVMGFEMPFYQRGARGQYCPFTEEGQGGQYNLFVKKGQRVQYCPFPEEEKGNTALLSRKGVGIIPPFLDKVTRQKCKEVTWGQNCSFVKEGHGVQTALFPKRGKGAIMP